MKNITLAIDEGVLASARKYASSANTTVNALVRQHLEQLARNHDRAKQAVRELREMSETTDARLGPDYRWRREDSYER